MDSERPSNEPQPVGLFTVSDELLLAGRYKLSAALLGEEIVGSPIELLIIPAMPDGDHCLLVPPPAPAIAHEPVTFVVQPRDRFVTAAPPSSGPACKCSPRRLPPLALHASAHHGASLLRPCMQVLTTAPTPHAPRFDNTLPPHELHLAVAQGAVVARADGPTRPRCAVRARGDGSIDVTVLANLSGDYRLHIWVNGAQVLTTTPARARTRGAAYKCSPRRPLLSSPHRCRRARTRCASLRTAPCCAMPPRRRGSRWRQMVVVVAAARAHHGSRAVAPSWARSVRRARMCPTLTTARCASKRGGARSLHPASTRPRRRSTTELTRPRRRSTTRPDLPNL